MTRRTLLVLLALIVLTPPIAVSAQQPRPGGVFRVGVPDPPALDPHQVVNFLPQTVVSLAYGHLLRFPAGPEQTSSTDFRILPDLAEKWEYQNPTTLVFSLRRGVRFHKKPPVNGREVVADDVKYSLERFRAKSPIRARFDPVQSIDVVDRYTVPIVLKEPFAPFLNHLASASHTAILPREAEERVLAARALQRSRQPQPAQTHHGLCGTSPKPLGRVRVAEVDRLLRSPRHVLPDELHV